MSVETIGASRFRDPESPQEILSTPDTSPRIDQTELLKRAMSLSAEIATKTRELEAIERQLGALDAERSAQAGRSI